MKRRYILGVDAGGTFTDFVCVAYTERGGGGVCVESVKIHKTLSTPHAPEEAILQGIEALGLMGASSEVYIVHGSTVATNAVLEGRLARTAFVTNRGFADMLQLARQTRPALYALEFEPRPPPVPPSLCFEIGGRLGADGAVVQPLTEADIETLTAQIKAKAPEAVAINLLFSFLDSTYEKRIAEALHKALNRDAKTSPEALNKDATETPQQALRDSSQAAPQAPPPVYISRSSAVLPEYKEYERGIATWLNAALGPVVGGYLERLGRRIGPARLQVMQSSGETVAAESAAEGAVRLLLSGPAGGLAAMHYLGGLLQRQHIISFDMGGTSTDVALLDGDIRISNESRIGPYPVAVPMVDMHTIGAGGGSIAYVDSGGLLQVGPRSAGAEPGPACYGRGGTQPTVTDANLVLGRLPGQGEMAGGLRLDRAAARAAVARVAVPLGLGVEEAAAGIIAIADELMAKAIQLISVNRGFDPADFVLACFGGAGGLHVCAVAEAMGMGRALVPVNGGVLSALGMVVARQGRQFSRTMLSARASASASGETRDETKAETKDETRDETTRDGATIEAAFAELADQGRAALIEEGAAARDLQISRSADLRYRGQSYTLNVPYADADVAAADNTAADSGSDTHADGWQAAVAAFHRLHRQRYGYALSNPVELVNLRVKVTAAGFPLPLPELTSARGDEKSARGDNDDGSPIAHTEVHGIPGPVPVYDRARLTAAAELPGPAIITEYAATTYIAPGWQCRPDNLGNLHLTAARGIKGKSTTLQAARP